MCYAVCCPKKVPPHTPRYEVSIAVQPKPTVSISRVQPSETPPRSPSTESIDNIAHARFASTDQISLQAVLRSSPSTIHKVPKEEKK